MNPIACTCPNWCARHSDTEVTDERERVLLDSLENALDACHAMGSPTRVRAALFHGTAVAIELGATG